MERASIYKYSMINVALDPLTFYPHTQLIESLFSFNPSPSPLCLLSNLIIIKIFFFFFPFSILASQLDFLLKIINVSLLVNPLFKTHPNFLENILIFQAIFFLSILGIRPGICYSIENLPLIISRLIPSLPRTSFQIRSKP